MLTGGTLLRHTDGNFRLMALDVGEAAVLTTPVRMVNQGSGTGLLALQGHFQGFQRAFYREQRMQAVADDELRVCIRQ